MKKNSYKKTRLFGLLFVFAIIPSVVLGIEAKTSKKELHSETVLIGPEEAQLDSQLMISAEHVIIRGKIVTNGFGITIVARVIEFLEGAEIISFDKARMPNNNALPARPSPDNAKGGHQGQEGQPGLGGLPGHSGHQSPGAIMLYTALIIGAPKINGNGQQGGQGGPGQAGQPGGKGGRGTAADSGPLGLWWNAGPGAGAPGGRGGTGGPGGLGGAGGAPTPIEVHYGKYFRRLANGALEELTLNSDAQLVSKGGQGGQGGKPGANGPSGPGGEGGYASRTLWGSSGGGNQGASGTANAQPSSSGEGGTPNPSQGPIVQQGSYAEITDETLALTTLIESINATRRLDALVTAFTSTFEHQKATDAETLKNKLNALRFRLRPLSELLCLMRTAPEGEREGRHDLDESAKLLEDFSRQIDRVLQGQAPLQSDLDSLEERSRLIMDRVHGHGIESMKAVCKKILSLKDRFLSEDVSQAVAVNAYRIFGPKELEAWVLKTDIAGSRDSLIPLHEMKTSILGAKESYPIHVGDEKVWENKGEPIVLP